MGHIYQRVPLYMALKFDVCKQRTSICPILTHEHCSGQNGTLTEHQQYFTLYSFKNCEL